VRLLQNGRQAQFLMNLTPETGHEEPHILEPRGGQAPGAVPTTVPHSVGTIQQVVTLLTLD